MKTSLQPGESVLREGGANLQRGWEAVGGRLFLTDQRLCFESHAFNVQSGPVEIPLAAITALRPAWTKFLGFLPVFPNSLVVRAGETEYSFVLHGRQQWADAIGAQANRLGAAAVSG